MAKKKTETDIDSLLEIKPEEEPVKEETIKQYELVETPEEVSLQTIANEPAQTFNIPSKDALKGVGGSYYIDATGTRVKRTK